MRSSITLFDDQYKLYKTWSKKLLVAFVEYMFEWIEPNLKPSEMNIFNSLRDRMDASVKAHDGRSKWWKNSHGWPSKKEQKMNEKWTKNEQKTNENAIWNINSGLQTTNSWTTAIKRKNILSYDNIYADYYGKNKWIDNKVCDKLIGVILNQWYTIDDIKKCLTIYNCECRIRQEYRYVKKLETWLKEFQPLNDEQIDEALWRLAAMYKSKNNSDPKFQNWKIAVTIWNDLVNTFWEEKIREMRKREWRKQINLNLT